MNNLKAEYNIESHSVQLKLTIEALPQVGVDRDGTYNRTSWAGCAMALSYLLDVLDGTREALIHEIEAELTGVKDIGDNNENGPQDED